MLAIMSRRGNTRIRSSSFTLLVPPLKCTNDSCTALEGLKLQRTMQLKWRNVVCMEGDAKELQILVTFEYIGTWIHAVYELEVDGKLGLMDGPSSSYVRSARDSEKTRILAKRPILRSRF